MNSMSYHTPVADSMQRKRAPRCESWLALSISGGAQRPPLVGSRGGAWDRGPGFHPPPHQTVREVLPHTAFRQLAVALLRRLDNRWRSFRRTTRTECHHRMP